MSRENATMVEVDDLGTVERIVYTRDGVRYEHEFESDVAIGATADGLHIIIYGGSLTIDDEGWIHG